MNIILKEQWKIWFWFQDFDKDNKKYDLCFKISKILIGQWKAWFQDLPPTWGSWGGIITLQSSRRWCSACAYFALNGSSPGQVESMELGVWKSKVWKLKVWKSKEWKLKVWWCSACILGAEWILTCLVKFIWKFLNVLKVENMKVN